MMKRSELQNIRCLPMLLQGVYFFITGLWPIVHIESFLSVTGPKEEIWLVKTFGGIVLVISVILLYAWSSRNTDVNTFLLAIISAVTLGAFEAYYVFQDIIPPVYLIDAFIELIFVVLYIRLLLRGGQSD